MSSRRRTAERRPFAQALDEQVGCLTPLTLIVDRDRLTEAVKVVEGLPEGSIVILIGGNAKLRPQAFYCFVSALISADKDAAYSDHDHEDLDGRRSRPVFKPQMSPDFMCNFSYAGPVVALRMTRRLQSKLPIVLKRALEIDPAALCAVAAQYDRKRITRLPLCLYSVPRTFAENETGLDFIYEFVPGTADHHSISHIVDLPQVRIIIPTRDRHELLEACISSILEKTDYPRDQYRVIVVDNSSSDPASLEYLRRIEADRTCSVIPSPGPFNFSKICNDGAASTDGEVSCLSNNDITVIDSEWLKILVSYAQEADAGIGRCEASLSERHGAARGRRCSGLRA